MDELNVSITAVDDYTVCNGVKATKCVKFKMFEHDIWMHRPVDDKRTTRLHGWQFSVNGIPISYLPVPNISRGEAVASFVMRSTAMGYPNWKKMLEKTMDANAERLAAV